MNSVRCLAGFVLALALAGCVVAPSYQYVAGGQRVAQPGVSFVLPPGRRWAALMRNTYRAYFITAIKPKNLTLVTANAIYPLPALDSADAFVAYLDKQRLEQVPDTGRFEQISHQESLTRYDGASCLVYQSASKDLSPDARRAGGHTIFKTYGMHCRYPSKPTVGVFVELSQKAPPGTDYPTFEPMAKALLDSVRFKAF